MTVCVHPVRPDAFATMTPGLADILHACVEDGASVGFILPFTRADAERFWSDAIRPQVAAGRRILLAASLDGRPVGTAQLIHDMPPNQPHRGEVAKVLVHPYARRRGVARALMAEIEAHARAMNRTLLTLDTRTGDPSQSLYASLGYRVAGEIPDWCRDTATTRLNPTTIMYKAL